MFEIRGGKIWVFDLDDTLADTSPRAHLNPRLQDNGDGWIPYSMACADDLPIAPTIALTTIALIEGFQPWIITGRTELAESLTRRWLRKHEVRYSTLLMRAEGDHRGNVELKMDYLEMAEKIGYECQLWVDDYPKVIDAVSARGIPTLLYKGQSSSQQGQAGSPSSVPSSSSSIS